MPERRLRPPGNPVLGHVLKIELSVPLKELLPRRLGKVRRASGGSRSVNGRRQSQIATRIVHEAAADRDRIQIAVKPGAVIKHHAEKTLLVSSTRARHAAAVFAAEIDR